LRFWLSPLVYKVKHKRHCKTVSTLLEILEGGCGTGGGLPRHKGVSTLLEILAECTSKTAYASTRRMLSTLLEILAAALWGEWLLLWIYGHFQPFLRFWTCQMMPQYMR